MPPQHINYNKTITTPNHNHTASTPPLLQPHHYYNHTTTTTPPLLQPHHYYNPPLLQPTTTTTPPLLQPTTTTTHHYYNPTTTTTPPLLQPHHFYNPTTTSRTPPHLAQLLLEHHDGGWFVPEETLLEVIHQPPSGVELLRSRHLWTSKTAGIKQSTFRSLLCI